MLTLLMKDFKLMFPREGSRLKSVLKILFSIISTALFIAIETVFFIAVLKKIDSFKGAPLAFTVLFLMVISLLLTFATVFKAKKLFFNELDMQQLSPHPIENSMQIFSKLVFVFLTHYVSSLMFTLPIFISYGYLYHKTMIFYYLAVFYPVFTGIFEIGIALLLVYPVWMFFEFLKKHVFLELSLSIIMLFALAIPYSYVLNIFIGLVSNNDILLIFTEESMTTLRDIQQHAFPLNLLIDAFLNGRSRNFFPYVSISVSVLILGLSITVFTFHKVRNLASSSTKAKGGFKKPKSQTYALIKKEISLLIKKPEYILSYTALLAVQPFLTYLILKAMNTVFQSGTFLYYTTLFPGFVPLVDVFLVMMVAIVINSGANSYVAIEERTIKNLKTIPVPYKKQLLIKVTIPFILSSSVLLISLLILYLNGILSLLTTVFAGLLTIVFLLIFDVVSLIEELQIRHAKPRSTFISTLISYVLPFLYVALGILLSYIGVPLALMFIAGLAVLLIASVPIILTLFKNMGRWFMELEAIN